MWIVDQMVTVTSLALNTYIVNKPIDIHCIGSIWAKKPSEPKNKANLVQ